MHFSISRSCGLALALTVAWLWILCYCVSRLTPQIHNARPDQFSRAKPTRSKIGKVTVAANKLDNSIIHRALQTHAVQNDIHGYIHYIATNEAVSGLTEHDTKKPRGAWTKPAYLLSIVVSELEKPERERLKWLFWFDADTIVLNPQTPLEVFLPPEPELSEVHLLMASNWDGLNSGAFAIRVHPWSASLLSAVLSYPIYKSDKMKTDRFRDQSAFQWLLQDPDSPIMATENRGREHWAIVPMRWFNSFPFNNPFDKHENGGWILGHKMTGSLFDNGTSEVHDDGHGGHVQPWKVMQGDIMVHFAGTMTGGTRDSWMGPWLDRAESLLPEWSNKTTQVALKNEAREFWRQVAEGT